MHSTSDTESLYSQTTYRRLQLITMGQSSELRTAPRRSRFPRPRPTSRVPQRYYGQSLTQHQTHRQYPCRTRRFPQPAHATPGPSSATANLSSSISTHTVVAPDSVAGCVFDGVRVEVLEHLLKPTRVRSNHTVSFDHEFKVLRLCHLPTVACNFGDRTVDAGLHVGAFTRQTWQMLGKPSEPVVGRFEVLYRVFDGPVRLFEFEFE